MSKSFNIFEHHHDHHHDAPITPAEMDPAQRALADALRVCFLLLKGIMAVLVVLYLCSGIFTVKPNEQAVVLRLGAIQGKGAISGDGLQLSWPFPIGEVVRIPRQSQTLELGTQFWYDMTGVMAGGPPVARALNPERDGSNLTGDANLVHTKWVINYKIDDAIDYVKNVGTIKVAEKVLRNATEQAIVHAMAELEADLVMRRTGYAEKVQTFANLTLTALGSGITVTSVTMTHSEMPGSVREAYNAVINADTDRERKITDAEKEASMIVRTVAGQAYGPLWELVKSYENAIDSGDKAASDARGAELRTAFMEQKVKGDVIGGTVAQLLNSASTYRTQVVEEIKAEANRFSQLLPHYNETPRIVVSRLWTEAKEDILSGDVESIYLPPGRFVLELNRDPEVEKARERKKLEDEAEIRRRAALGQRSPVAP